MNFLINHFKRILRDHGIADFDFVPSGEDMDLIIRSKLPVELDGKILQTQIPEQSVFNREFDPIERHNVDKVETLYTDLAVPDKDGIKIHLTPKNYAVKLGKLESLLIHNPIYKPTMI